MLDLSRIDTSRVVVDYTFPTNNVVLAAAVGATADATINIGAEAPFLVLKRTAQVLAAADAVPANPDHVTKQVLVQMRISDNSRVLTEVPVPLFLWSGTGQLPYILPHPLYLIPNSQIFLTFTNLVATAFNVRAAFLGVKLYGEAGGPSRTY